MPLDPTGPSGPFLQLIDSTLGVNEQNAIAGRNGDLRAWMVDDNLWDGNVLAVDEIGKGFSRTEAATAYNLALQYRSAGIAAACKVESDYLAAAERAFRLRHATPVRCALHAAARRLGHADRRGPVGRVEAHVQGLRTAGGQPPP